MIKLFKVIVFISVVFVFYSCKMKNSVIDKTVVDDFDIQKYLGTWYEIARYDHKFERGLEGVTATYSMRDDGKIKVLNKGYKGGLNGKESIAIGKAKIPNPAESAKLKVSFFLFFYADYFVMELDTNYQWAVVGSSSDKYLWILSRTSQLESTIYSHILDLISKRGYDVSKLIKVKQK